MKPVLAKASPQGTLNEAPRAAIRSIYDATMRYTGQATGELYTWNKIGDVVLVCHEDADFLLSKRLGGRSCCGGVDQDGNKIFVKES
jgi:hypothetical protein